MDFFETQERYRRQEMRGWILFLARVVVVGGVVVAAVVALLSPV